MELYDAPKGKLESNIQRVKNNTLSSILKKLHKHIHCNFLTEILLALHLPRNIIKGTIEKLNQNDYITPAEFILQYTRNNNNIEALKEIIEKVKSSSCFPSIENIKAEHGKK